MSSDVKFFAMAAFGVAVLALSLAFLMVDGRRIIIQRGITIMEEE